MTINPNFPTNFAITPNADPSVPNYALGDACKDTFGPEAQQEAISKYGIAGRIWEGAHALCTYIDSANELDFDPPFMDDPRVPLGIIELGSGTGIAAASVANLIRNASLPGSFIIPTDLPDVCPLLEHNLGIDDNSKVVFVRPLIWGNLDHAVSISNEFGFGGDPSAAPRGRLTHIICSDIVYIPRLFGPLLRSLIHLTSPSNVGSSAPHVKVTMSCLIRSLMKEVAFWSAFGLWFSFHPVMVRRRESGKGLPEDEPDEFESWRQLGEECDIDHKFVFVAYRRPESMTWKIPESDQDLMDGVGAWGTTVKKGDETFETTLLMIMGIDT